MDFFAIEGGVPLRGSVRISGSKNAALPILIATLLTDEPCTVRNVPDLRDMRTTYRLIEQLGKRVVVSGAGVRVEPRRRLGTRASYELVKQMRASFLVAGPLVGRFKEARVPLPGGCAIGLRPIDIHLDGFRRMGARASHAQGDVVLKTRALRPSVIPLRFASVGATENLMMAAAAVCGRTVIKNAAREPEIADLAVFLNRLGARVEGAGSAVIRIEGARRLRGTEHAVIPDRIETGTYLIAAAMTGGDVLLEGARPDHSEAVLEAIERSGARIRETDGGLRIKASGRPRPVSVATAPYPGFPTDLQAPWMAFMSLARGTSRLREEIFEKRFLHAAELGRMGADIRTNGDTALIRGVSALSGAPVMASDLRAGAALVCASLAAQGQSLVQRVYHIDRGYERMERKLSALGAKIRRIK